MVIWLAEGSRGPSKGPHCVGRSCWESSGTEPGTGGQSQRGQYLPQTGQASGSWLREVLPQERGALSSPEQGRGPR